MMPDLVEQRPEKVRKATTRFCRAVRIQSVMRGVSAGRPDVS